MTSVIDLGTRSLIGYAMDKRMTTELITTALKKADDSEPPDPESIFHSDRGSQHCSHAFQNMFSEYLMTSSMSRRSQCWAVLHLTLLLQAVSNVVTLFQTRIKGLQRPPPSS